jgi:4-hydroxybenzoate polyprenyltransferase
VIAPLIRSLRPAQWPKNLFVLAPLVFGNRLGDLDTVRRALLALLAFCCAASAVYLLNDLRDRNEDRLHPLKRLRPLAAGTLKVPVAVVAMILLTAAVALVAVYLGAGFAVVMGAYLLLNVFYTLWFKHMVILDVMCISLGFVLRVVAGARATQVEVSSWLFLCTTFLALFLAFSKRRHEITLLAEGAAGQRPVLDHYSPAFLDQMINVVTASAVVSYALYAVAPETVAKFHTQRLIYTIPLVLYGIFRYLYLMYQRPEQRNPTEAILRDLPSLVNVALWGLAVVWIVYGNSAATGLAGPGGP